MENFLIRGMSIYVGSLLWNISFLPPLAIDEAEHVIEGYGFSSGAALIFCQKWCLELRNLPANLSASEAAACWVGAQLGQSRIECVVNFKVF